MFHLNSLAGANVILVAVLVALVVHMIAEAIRRRNLRREHVADAADVASKYGMFRLAELGNTYAQGRYVDFWNKLKAFIKLVTGSPKAVVEELEGAMKHIAATPDGLKMLQGVLASVTPPAPVAAA